MKIINEYLSTKIKKTKIKATDADIKEIVHNEIHRLGRDADLNHIDVSSVTNFSKVFYLKDFIGDVSLWNVSKGIDFSFCFCGNKSFDGDLSGWNVENGEIFKKMFALDTMFTGIGLENWKVNNCTDFSDMFNGCKNFNVDISNWKISINTKSFTNMFKECESFTQDLSKWKISKYSDKMDMFWHCPLSRRKNNKPQVI